MCNFEDNLSDDILASQKGFIFLNPLLILTSFYCIVRGFFMQIENVCKLSNSYHVKVFSCQRGIPPYIPFRIRPT